MTPFCVQELIIKLKDIFEIKKDIISNKYNFCIQFEKELQIQKSNYSEDVFDFLFNLFDNKKVFKENQFKKVISDIMDLNFNDFLKTNDYIREVYTNILWFGKDYFFSIFKFDHDDPAYIGQKFMEKRQENFEKLINF